MNKARSQEKTTFHLKKCDFFWLFQEIALSLHSHFAEIAQLVEHDLAKVGVAGSSPVFRSFFIFYFQKNTLNL